MNARPEPTVRYTPATPERLPEIVRLLSKAGLPTDDVNLAAMAGFEVAVDDAGRVVGVAGVEVLDGSALLRSVAVAQDWRGKGVARALVDRCESVACVAGAKTIYLLTTSARALFQRLGYADVARDAVPPAIATHAQFRSLCPASAMCLGKRL